MKNLASKFEFLTLILLLALCSFSYSQVSVSIKNMSYSIGGNVNNGEPIQIQNESNVRILFNVELTKPSNQVTGNSTLKIFVKKPQQSKIQVGSTEYICNICWTTFYSSSKDVTINSSTLSNNDGVLFAEFESSSGIKYKSADWSIEILDAPISNNSISGNQTISQGQTASQITGSNPTGGNGSYSYQWQRNLSGSWSNISGATSKNYSPGAISQSTMYRRVVLSGSSPNSISNTATITVNSNPPITNNTIHSNGTNKMIGSIPSGGNGSFTYKWLISNNIVHDEIIPGETNKDLNVPPIHFQVGSYFKRIVTSGGKTSDSGYVPCNTSNKNSNNFKKSSSVFTESINRPKLDNIVYPNPSNGPVSFHVKIDNENTALNISIIEITSGVKLEVFQGIVQPGLKSIDWEKPLNLPEGIYSYIITKNGLSSYGKLIFKR